MSRSRLCNGGDQCQGPNVEQHACNEGECTATGKDFVVLVIHKTEKAKLVFKKEVSFKRF
jgi:hypothetical protein